MSAPAPAAQGPVHDLSYRRYDGPRLGPATRFLVVARYALMIQWRERAVKLFLLGSILASAVGAAIAGFYWAGTRLIGVERASAAAQRELAAVAVTGALTAQWVPAFLLVLVCGAPSVSADLRAGAFQFHFARPVSAGHYLAGRMIGATFWAALGVYGTLCLFAGERLALSGDLAGTARLVAAGVAAGTLRLAALGAVALGCSSLTRRKGLAQAMFAAAVLGSGMLSSLVASNARAPWVKGLSVMGASSELAEVLLGTSELTGAQAAAPALAGAAWTGLALALAWARLARVEVVRG